MLTTRLNKHLMSADVIRGAEMQYPRITVKGFIVFNLHCTH